MALSATCVFEVRTGGSDTNGGGFDPGVSAPGTDFSQQNSAQTTFSDLVIGNPTTTQLTSAAHPFGVTSPGNFINITGGTGFTTGRYEILSVSGTTATMDRSVGTAGSTAGTGNLGGAFASPGAASNVMSTGGQTMFVKQGTYSINSSSEGVSGGGIFTGNVLGASETLPILIIGYNTTRTVLNTDVGPTINQAVNSINGIDIQPFTVFRNFLFTNTNSFAGGTGISSSSRNSIVIENVQISNWNLGILISGSNWHLYGCYVTGCTDVGYRLFTGNTSCTFVECTSDGNGLNTGLGGFRLGSTCTLIQCISANNNGPGFNMATDNAQDCILYQCTAYNNQGSSGSGYEDNGGRTIYINCLGWGNNLNDGEFRDNADVTPNYLMRLIGCAAFNFTSASITSTSNLTGFVFLTANPFNNPAGKDFSLNGVVGGGSACKNAGYPQRYYGIPTVSFFDIGAAQHNG